MVMEIKNIQTSNFARKGSDPFSIAICATVPKWYNGKRLEMLAPTWHLVDLINKGKITSEEYDQAYLSLLKSKGLTGQKVIDILPERCFLLCYESPKDKCHRRLLAEWVKIETGFNIPEWKTPNEQKELEQQELVNNLLKF